MTDPCDEVVERIALGEPVGEADHVAECEQCQRTLAVASRLGALHDARDPGLGFSARIVAGAQHRLTVRRRRRVAGGLAAMVATAAVGVFVTARIQAANDDDADGPGHDGPVATTSTPAPAPAPHQIAATPAAHVDPGPHPEDPYKDPPAGSDTDPADPADVNDPWDLDSAGGDRDVITLVELADTRAALAPSVDWGRIEAPLAPYHTLVEGVKP